MGPLLQSCWKFLLENMKEFEGNPESAYSVGISSLSILLVRWEE